MRVPETGVEGLKMSFYNSFTSALKKLRRSFSNENGAMEDSEKIHILHASATSSGAVTTTEDGASPTGPPKRRLTCPANEAMPSGSSYATTTSLPEGLLKPADHTYHNSGYLWSPSEFDLQKSWKLKQSDMAPDEWKRTRNEYQGISIQRRPVDSGFIHKKYGVLPRETSSEKAAEYIKSRCVCSFACFLSCLTSLFPFLSWMPAYKLEYLLPDIISGFTIVILHIPQGMAYGILASVEAENGLYVSFFPVLVYFLLGTSKHISIGTFAVVSLMTSTAVFKMNGFSQIHDNSTITLNATSPSVDVDSYSLPPPNNLQIVTSIAIAVGILQLFMGIFRLGSLTVVLSDQLVSGFTTGAACHVATSQLKDLFGIYVGRYSGPLTLIYMLRDVFRNIVDLNLATLLTSAVAIFLLAIFKEQVDKRLKNKFKMPFPIDLIVVVLATTISYYANFNLRYGVLIMGSIPIGLPAPVAPRMDIIPSVIGDSFAIAVVAFVISLSMAKLLSKKHGYEIRPNQELLALGCANVFSSFFACYPCSASLSRSLVQERAGGKTQIAGLVSCGILLVVLLALAPLFYTLPKCILACVILVALKGMFLQVKDFKRAWCISKLDAFIWLVTFMATIFLDVTFGLLVGVLFSILSVIIRTVIPSKTFLGRIPDTDIYLDIKRYDVAQEINGIKIFHFESALYFINREIFKSYLMRHVPLEYGCTSEENGEKIKRIIIDCSTFMFVDMSGLDTLLEVMKEYHEVGINVFLAGCSIALHDVMERAKFLEKIPQDPSIFPTIQDAVEYKILSQELPAKSPIIEP